MAVEQPFREYTREGGSHGVLQKRRLPVVQKQVEQTIVREVVLGCALPVGKRGRVEVGEMKQQVRILGVTDIVDHGILADLDADYF